MQQESNPAALYSRAAQWLADAREAGVPGRRLPEICRPKTMSSAVLIQHYLGTRINARIGGWKSSVQGPPEATAPIYESDIHWDVPCRIPPGRPAQVEPEIAYFFGQDLAPRRTPYSEAELCAAVAETRLSLELIGSRYAQPAKASFLELLADNLSNQGVFLGPAIPCSPGEVPGIIPITVIGPDGVLVQSPGRHPAGRPFEELIRLTQALGQRGETIGAGQVMLTGTFAGLLDLPAGCDLRVCFGELGTLKVEFSATAAHRGPRK